MLHKWIDMWSRCCFCVGANVYAQGFVLVSLTISLLLCCFFLGRRSRKHPPLPGPRGLPLLGYLPFIGTDLRWTFRDLAAIYGPIFRVRLGTQECIVVTSPSHVKQILKEQDAVFAYRVPTVSAKLATFGASDIAFSDYGPELRKMKKIFVAGMLSTANFDYSHYLRKQRVKKMISETYKRAGELVDVGDLVFFTVFNSVMSMVWGDTMNNDNGSDDRIQRFDTEFRSVVAEFILLLGTPNVSDFLPFVACFDLQGIRRKMKLVADKIETFFDLVIDKHFASKVDDNQKDMLSYLLELTKLNDPATSLTVPQVKAILMDAIVGGMDTTAITIEWAMAELLNHPKIMRKVQEELDETVGLNKIVEESDLPKLKYLNAVLKETLRLHPPVALLVPHRSSKETSVGGYTVENNAMVFVNTWAIHRDPNLWDCPLEFRPERFLSGSESFDFSGNQHKYLPFSSGRRMCPGLSLAEKLSMSVLSSMLHSFDWKLPDGDVDMSERFGFVVKKVKPTMAIPSPRLTELDLYLDQ